VSGFIAKYSFSLTQKMMTKCIPHLELPHRLLPRTNNSPKTQNKKVNNGKTAATKQNKVYI